jgi:transcriptional regulator with XRE-family HTH domain
MQQSPMIIGDRLREMREGKKLSQGDIEKRTGLLHCYISRVVNGHTVPAIETLEKLARALEIPLYQLFYEGEEPPKLPHLLKRNSPDDTAWGSTEEKLVISICFVAC